MNRLFSLLQTPPTLPAFRPPNPLRRQLVGGQRLRRREVRRGQVHRNSGGGDDDTTAPGRIGYRLSAVPGGRHVALDRHRIPPAAPMRLRLSVLGVAAFVAAPRADARACSSAGPTPHVIDASMQATDHVAPMLASVGAWVQRGGPSDQGGCLSQSASSCDDIGIIHIDAVATDDMTPPGGSVTDFRSRAVRSLRPDPARGRNRADPTEHIADALLVGRRRRPVHVRQLRTSGRGRRSRWQRKRARQRQRQRGA
jgi:hypothetical protein